MNRLVSKGKRVEAVDNLVHFRKSHVPREVVENEIEVIAATGNEGKGGWGEVFNKQNRVSLVLGPDIVHFKTRH